MFLTPQSKDFQLLGHWLYNAKNTILNEEVLYLEIPLHRSIEQTFEIAKILVRSILKESDERILEDTGGCFATKRYSLYITPTTNLPDIAYENNRNIILISPIMINIKEFDRPILSISLKGHNLVLNNRFKKDPQTDEIFYKLITNLDYFSNKPFVNEYEVSQYYFKQLPLLQTMRDKDYKIIGNYLYDLLLKDRYHLKYEVLLSQTEYQYNRYHFKDLITDDIKMFVSQEILTARLSIVAYRIALWKFNEDRASVNKFYSQKLALGKPEQLSPSHLNLKFISRDLTFNKMFKGYDLRNLEEKQFKLAKEIIRSQHKRYDGEFDIEAIQEVTHLSYGQINQLINQISNK